MIRHTGSYESCSGQVPQTDEARFPKLIAVVSLEKPVWEVLFLLMIFLLAGAPGHESLVKEQLLHSREHGYMQAC